LPITTLSRHALQSVHQNEIENETIPSATIVELTISHAENAKLQQRYGTSSFESPIWNFQMGFGCVGKWQPPPLTLPNPWVQ
jgi:hypothetical protein